MPERDASSAAVAPSRARRLAGGLKLGWMLAGRDLRNRYASSYAGMAWSIGVPLLYSLVNVVVFSVLMRGRMGGRYGDVPFALFYFVPYTLWVLFAEVLGRSPSIVREYGFLINKIAFPVWTLPLVPLASALLSQAVMAVLVVVLMAWNGVSPGATAWVILPVWALGVMIAVGASYALSALAVYVPDMGQLVPVGLNILFWLTPILYPAAMVESADLLWLRSIVMDLNPLYYLVESSRLAVFGGGAFPWWYLGVLAAVAAVLMAFGTWLFRKLQPGFADVL